MTSKFICFLFFQVLFMGQFVSAQSILLNEDGGQPDPSAILELRSNRFGLLIPRMISSNRLSIPNPAKGLLVYQTNESQGFYFYNGTAWDTLEANSVVNPVTAPNTSNIAIIRDRKPAGTDGGSFLSGHWDTRDLTELTGDSNFVQIDGDSIFSLDSGLYEINISAPARLVDEHQVRLLNLDSNAVVANGTVAVARSVSTTSELYTVFKISVTTRFIVQHQCTTDNLNPEAKGWAIPWGDCIYTQIRIQRFE